MALLPTEAKIGTSFGQVDPADHVTVWSITPHAVLGGITPSHAAPNISVQIGA